MATTVLSTQVSNKISHTISWVCASTSPAASSHSTTWGVVSPRAPKHPVPGLYRAFARAHPVTSTGTSARARDSNCFSPVLRFPPCSATFPSRVMRSSAGCRPTAARMKRRIPSVPSGGEGPARFSRRVPRTQILSCGTTRTSALRCCSFISLIFTPPTSTVPSHSNNRLSTANSDVLPPPVLPHTAVLLYAGIVSDSPCSTGADP
mmetsp:Transcript_122100/g.279672  ORF Transcript_122100/g.279672 Transcript_122100/m.279672 type:complete len:206 (-) Transcript_122100:1216-1833(-)